MSSLYGIDSLGMYGYDPYFMAAYQSYNPNFRGASNTQATQTKQTAQAATNATTQQPAVTKPAEEKSSNAGLILGGIAAVGAAALCIAAHKKGNGANTLEKIKNGFSQMWQGARNMLPKKPEKFSIRQVENGSEYICTVPGKKNILKGESMVTEAQKLGIPTDVAALADKNVNILDYTFKHNCDTFHVRNGNIVGYKNQNGENLLNKMLNPTEPGDIKYKDEILRFISDVNKHDTKALNKIKNVYYTRTTDGITQGFVAKAGKKKDGLRRIETNRFSLQSDVVNQYRQNNPEIDNAIKAFVKDGKSNGLKLAKAQYESSLGTFEITNGEISGIWKDGVFHEKGSTIYDSLLYQNKETFKNVLKNEGSFINKVYQAA